MVTFINTRSSVAWIHLGSVPKDHARDADAVSVGGEARTRVSLVDDGFFLRRWSSNM